jgi:16S rRNA (guanine1516-N2)-methyltransferase
MFPPKRRASALPRKEVQVLRAAVGDDPDAGDLLAAARRAARMRTVVKRADDAPVLGGPPSLAAEGRTVRFDVYLSAPAPEGGR